MQVEIEESQPTATTLIVRAAADDMTQTKARVEAELAASLKLPGFRKGTVPPELVAREVGQQALTEAFLQSFVPRLAQQALVLKDVKPVLTPEVAVTKFVPFEQLELTIKAEHLGAVELVAWRELKLEMPELKTTAEEVNKVLERVRLDFATFKTVARASKKGDRVWLDFQGENEKGEAITGASGRDYPLLLGESNFIAGFEEKVIGAKAGAELEFSLNFPQDHFPKHLAGEPVVFKVSLKKVESVNRPKLDDALAAKAGGLKSLAELKKIVRKQILADKRQKTREALLGRAVAGLAEKSKIEIPAGLETEELNRLEAEHKAWLAENQLSLEAWLKEAKLSLEEHQSKLKTTALSRLKGGLVLRQIAVEEKLTVADEELERHLSQHRTDDLDEVRLAELKHDIRAQLLVRKALDRLGQAAFAQKK